MKLQASVLKRWLFGSKLDNMSKAYAAARKTLDGDRASLEGQWVRFQEEVNAGRAEMVEEDDEGRHTYDHGEHFGDLDAEVENGLSLVRQAFVISLHHLWERELNDYLKVKHYVQQDAFDALHAEGLNVEETELDRLRLTCNVAKHSAGKAAADLYAKHPHMFRIDSTYTEPEYDNLIVTDADLESFFDAVNKSGFQPAK